MTLLVIRPADERDLPALLDLYNHAILTTTSVFDYEPHTLEMRREWFAAKQHAGFPVLVATIDDVFAGFATYGPFRAWPAYGHTIEHSVHVVESFRRRGIARALMRALISDARARGCHAMIAGIVSDNVSSIRLHESLGFVEVGHLPEVGYKFDRWLDLKFLHLIC